MDQPPHLTQDQLMQALIDATQLSSKLQKHLSTCLACKEKKTKLKNRFNDLKVLSTRITHQSRPWYHFHRGETYPYSPHPFGIKFMFIIVGVIVVILLLNRYDPFGFKSQDDLKEFDSYSAGYGPALGSTLPLPELYQGLLNISDQKMSWWQKETYINGLSLTSDDIKSLASAWKDAFNNFIQLDKAVSDEQVELTVTLEEKEFNKTMVFHHYQKLWQNYAHLTEERLNYLLKIRTILGYERFQDLLRLQKKQLIHYKYTSCEINILNRHNPPIHRPRSRTCQIRPTQSLPFDAAHLKRRR